MEGAGEKERGADECFFLLALGRLTQYPPTAFACFLRSFSAMGGGKSWEYSQVTMFFQLGVFK